MPGPGFCQFDAGILDAKDRLTPEAKKAFIKAVKDELCLGTKGAPKPFIPCGPDVPPTANADKITLEDEKAFPEFHKHALGLYEKMAVSLNLKGQFSILPICDPIALAVQLQLDVPKLKFPGDFITYGIALPALAVKLQFTLPIDLAAKFPQLLAQVKLPPSFNFPKFEFDLPAQVDLATFAFPYPKIPGMVLDLVAQMPSIFIKLMAFDFSAICSVVMKSKLFGDFDPATSPVWVTTNKVVVRKTVELIIIAVVATTLGSSSAGIVGNMGLLFGYQAPPGPKSKSPKPADLMVKAATEAQGMSWGQDTRELRKTGGDFGKATLKYTQFMMPQEISPTPKPGETLKPFNAGENAQMTEKAYRNAKQISSCVLFVRACLWRGGAQGAFFTKPFQDTGSMHKLMAAVDERGASIPFDKANMPALSKGDIVITGNPFLRGSEKSFVLTADFAGGMLKRVDGTEAGVPDSRNNNRPTAIEGVSYVFFPTTLGNVKAGRLIKDSLTVLRIIDAKKMVAGA